MFQQALAQIGLSEKESSIYELLLQTGQIKIGDLLKKVSLKRGDLYNVLYSLEKNNLVDEKKIAGLKYFYPKAPTALQEVVENKKKKIRQDEKILSDLLPNLFSQYHLTTDRPVVQYFEGVDGVKKIYKDILTEEKDFQLIRASFHTVYENKIIPITQKFIKKRMARNMSVQAITPRNKKALANEKFDAQILFDRQWASLKDYHAPVEINIYGDKVAFLSYGKEMIGTIIKSPQIAEAMKQIFKLARAGAKTNLEKTQPNV